MAKKTPPSKHKKKAPAKKAAKTPEAGAKTQVPAKTRPAQPKARSFRLQKRTPDALAAPKLPSVFVLTGSMLQLFRRHWRVLLGIVAVYAVLNFVLVRGFSIGGGYETIRQNLQHGGVGQLLSSSTLFLYLLGSSGSSAGTNVSAGTYQFALMLMVSLAIIWTLRQLTAGNKVGVRDGFYKGMTPLVPFMLIAGVIFLQLIPMVVGITLYGAVVTNGVASVFVERALWGIVAVVFSLISLYWVASSVFALYIVTLPDMTPRKALQAGRDLVAGRRWAALGRVAFLPVMLLAVTAALIIPLILIFPPLALWVFFVIGIVSIAVVHGYMYALYRAML